jgi:hypothetical protein
MPNWLVARSVTAFFGLEGNRRHFLSDIGGLLWFGGYVKRARCDCGGLLIAPAVKRRQPSGIIWISAADQRHPDQTDAWDFLQSQQSLEQ